MHYVVPVCIEDHFQARALLDVSSENFLHNAPWADWKFPQRHSRGLAQPRIEYIVTPDEQDPYPRGCHLAESSNVDIKFWAEGPCYFWSAGCIYPRKYVGGGDFSTIMNSKTGAVTAPPLDHGSLIPRCERENIVPREDSDAARAPGWIVNYTAVRLQYDV